MNKFTPGPWGFHTKLPVSVPHAPCMLLGMPHESAIGAVGEANARLIAAAPDGFAAAEAAYLTLLKMPHSGPRLTMEFQAAMSGLRSFIAKATGRDDQEVQDEYEARAKIDGEEA